MAAEDEGAESTAHGRPAGGHGHGLAGVLKGSHRNEIITICSVVGVLLAWLTLRRTKTPASGMNANGTTSAAQAAYLGGAGNVAGFDQSAVQTLTDNVQALGTNEQAMFQQLSDSMAKQAADQTSAQSGLADLLTKQQQSLTAINTSVSGLPQAIASVLPKPLPAPAPAPAAAPPPPAPAPGPRTYTVRSGDNLSWIGARFGESWQQLYAKNRGVVGGNPNLIRPGEVLTV